MQDGEGVGLRGPGPKQKWVETQLGELGVGERGETTNGESDN